MAINGVTLSVHRGGAGPALILLHGYPQNHMTWHRIAPRLAQHFDVIIPDLRGYGESDAPPDDAGHTVYSKREMARDIVGLMDALGLARAHVMGHDRGARVAYRLALDHPRGLRDWALSRSCRRLISGAHGIVNLPCAPITGPFWRNQRHCRRR